ncbi:MAG: hypothetical protein ACI9UK_001640 [Candidatus Krumholzibacteriia bacterium]|jgi:hypothetical protein
MLNKAVAIMLLGDRDGTSAQVAMVVISGNSLVKDPNFRYNTLSIRLRLHVSQLRCIPAKGIS